MVCAEGGFGCLGVAGMALVVSDGEDSIVLYGLSSWGDASTCAQVEVFTRITPFVGWIRGYMKGMTFLESDHILKFGKFFSTFDQMRS